MARSAKSDKRKADKHAQASEELSRAVFALVLKEPFLGHLLGQLPRTVSRAYTPTACVALEGTRVRMAVNPDFFAGTLTRRSQRVAVVKHEVLHVLLRHLLRREPRHQPFLYNVAADLVVNQLIGSWELPESAITLASFPDLALEPDRTLDHYYERLRAAPAGRESSAKLSALAEGWHSDHGRWGAGSDASAQVAEHELGRLVEQAARRAGPRGMGSLPGMLRELVEAWIEERRPVLDWRRALRIFGASSRRSRLVATLRRPSKRYGTFPGNRVRRFARLLVAVDTSGSISDDDLSDIFAEIRGMWRAGAEITIVECDAAVQRAYPYRGELPRQVAGRGGTAFDPVFAWMREQPERFDGCIYLTDGFGPTPERSPGCPLLWLVVGEGDGAALTQGRVVKLTR